MAEIARLFVEARRASKPMAALPGKLPNNPDAAYAIQRAAIEQWPDRIAGWKVGRIDGELEIRLGINRFIGPIFAKTVVHAQNGSVSDFPVIVGGFAAFEVEVIAVVGEDQPDMPVGYTPLAARAAIAGLHVGIEVAGSPLEPIHRSGPLISIAGFGNNLGLIIGPAIRDFKSRPPRQIITSTYIGNEVFGPSTAAVLPGGMWTAVAFALDQAARLGYPMRAGDVISTGALTGVHPVEVGQHCAAYFERDGLLRCVTVPIGRG